jgi:subtilisin family serine protease
MNNKWFRQAANISFLALLFLFAVTAFADEEKDRYRPGEVVCEMEPGYSIDIILNDYNTTVNGFQHQTNCYLLGIPAGQDAESLAAVIAAREEVRFCGANYYLDAPEPYQRSQPFLDYNFMGDFLLQPAALLLDLSSVYTSATGDDVKIAVIDGGINLTHPEFTTKSGGGVYSGWDYVDDDSIANDEPGGAGSGHGTFVAGVIKLMAPSSQIYAYRALDTLGRGDGYAIANAVLRAIDDSCKVINLSLGMVGRHEALDDALKYAERNEVIVVAAAGNDSSNADNIFPFPAIKASCLAVAALDSNNIKADFSNYGLKVDLCAPGTRIYSPYLDTLYAWWDGTSFAAPFVSGLAALMKSIDPQITWEDLDTILAQTSINIDSLNPGMEGMLGAGLIDPAAALNAVKLKVCGDADGSGSINVSDAVWIINYVFLSGPEPYSPTSGDPNCSSEINVSDAVYLINYIFAGGDAPCAGCE